MGNRFRLGLSKLRLTVLALLVLGIALAPATAQADPVTEEDCTAQLVATGNEPPEPTAEFTIVCENNAIVGVTFRTTQDAAIPGFEAQNPDTEENPLQGLNCVPPAGDEFQCGGRLEAGTTGLAEIGTQEDPCTTGLNIEDLTVDIDPEGPPGSEPPVPDEEDVVFDQAIQLQGCDDGTGGGGGGGGDGDGGGESNDCEVEQTTSGDSGDRETGDFEADDTRETESSGDDCDPEGGVDAGFGGNAGASNTGGPAAGHLPMALGGASLILLGLLVGGFALARRT